jgi:glycerol-3-phosphate cytidylyltransferase
MKFVLEKMGVIYMRQYKMGYTTGVFDMFHVGHLNILRQAKELCDYLVVGVSTDELVMEYKNKQPVIPHNERIAIVQGIKYVDEVVNQTNRDKFSAWEKLNFNIMFVGDDWKGKPLFNEVEKKFNQVGVEIVYFPYTKGISSTLLRDKVKQKEKVRL